MFIVLYVIIFTLFYYCLFYYIIYVIYVTMLTRFIMLQYTIFLTISYHI